MHTEPYRPYSCPRCGCEMIRTWATRPTVAVRVRYHECRRESCKFRWRSHQPTARR